jgi:hypothetical protein
MAKPGPKNKIKDDDLNRLKALMRLSPTLKDTANFFEVSEDTVERTIKKHWGLEFAEFRDQNAVATRLNLRRTAIRKAEQGDNTMIIWCMKNLCGWKDRQDVTSNDKTIDNSPRVVVTLPSNGREAKK